MSAGQRARSANKGLKALPSLSETPDAYEAVHWLSAAAEPCARALALYAQTEPPPGAPVNRLLDNDRRKLRQLLDQAEQRWMTCLDTLRTTRGTTAFEQTVRTLLRLTALHGAGAEQVPNVLRRLRRELRFLQAPALRSGSCSAPAWIRDASRQPERASFIRDPRARRFRS